jgi:N4-gp56 family major capsid protein
MANEQILARTLSTNSFTTGGTGATGLNPEIVARRVEDYMKAKLVVAPLGKVFTELLGQAGDSIVLNFNTAITAGAIAESDAITPSAMQYTAVTFTPSEYGVAVALTRKQRIRAIQDIMEEKAMDMGYALAKLKDTLAVTTLVGSAGNSVVTNAKALASIQSSDVLNTDDIANGLKELRIDEHDGKYLIIHPKQENSLLKNSNFIDASVYGGREVVMNGEIGKYLGIRVLVSTQIPRNGTTSTAYDALLLDNDVFGIAVKMPVTFNADYRVLEREFLLAAVEEYDIKVLRTNGVCKITSYGG